MATIDSTAGAQHAGSRSLWRPVGAPSEDGGPPQLAFGITGVAITAVAVLT